MSLIHSSYYRPRVYAYNGNVTASQVDRLQDLTASVTLNREKLKEIGRDGTVDWQKKIPSVRVSLRQYEYGNINFWQQLANTSTKGAAGQAVIDLATDFKTSMVDLVGYKTDDDGTFIGSIWYPKLRVSSWGLNIGDPQGLVERSYELIGEDEIILENNNKYFVYTTQTATGSGSQNFSITNPTPSGDPDNSGYYLFRVVRYRGTTTTELAYTTDYTYNGGTKVLNIVSASIGDVYKLYYSSATYSGSVFTNNDSDAAALEADACSIYLHTGTYVYRLQSVAIDCTYDRADYYEIGNSNIVARGIRNKTVRITLGRILDDYTVEEALRGVGSTFGKLNPRNFLDNISLRVMCYSSDAKTTFKMGYKFTNLSPTNLDWSTPLSDYINRGAVLEGEEGFISADSNQFLA